MTCGSIMPMATVIILNVSFVTVAVKAITLTDDGMRLRTSPSREYAARNVVPLCMQQAQVAVYTRTLYAGFMSNISYGQHAQNLPFPTLASYKLTYHLSMQWASSITTATSLSL